jgi:quinol monooxygenase YgiN
MLQEKAKLVFQEWIKFSKLSQFLFSHQYCKYRIMKNVLLLFSLVVLFASCSNSNPKYAENLATAQKLFALHGEENLEQQLNLISKDIESEPPFYGSEMIGYDVYTSMLKGYHDAFNDIKYTAQVWLPGTDSLGVLDGSVRTYGKWTGVQAVTGKQLNLKGYWYFGFDDNGLINAQGDFFDAGGMLNAVYSKNLVHVSFEVLPGKIDQVMEILNSEAGLPATRYYDGCISVELTINEENNTIYVQENWESYDKFNTYIQWRQTEDTAIAALIPLLKGGENGLKIVQPNSNYKSY